MRWLALAVATFGAIGLGFAVASPVAAQTTAPANFYGRGAPLKAGDQVSIRVNGVTCATSTVNAALEWAVAVPITAPCAPTENVAVTVTVNGAAATLVPSAVWKVGGTPPDVANGYAMSVAGSGSTTGTTSPGSASAVSLSGSIPKTGGYGIIAVNSPGTIQQVAEATGCPTSTMALFATVGGSFLAYVPGTSIAAVNAGFLAAFPNGNMPVGTALMGKCV